MTDVGHCSEIFLAEREGEISQETLDLLQDAHKLKAQCPVFHKKFFLPHSFNLGRKRTDARGQVKVYFKLE